MVRWSPVWAWALLLSGCIEFDPQLPDLGPLGPVDMRAVEVGPDVDPDRGPVDMQRVDMRAADMRSVDMRPTDMHPADMRVVDAAHDTGSVDMRPEDPDMRPVEPDMRPIDAAMDAVVDAACAPADELCNGVDDDCDGAVDEGTGCVFCTADSVGPPCNGCPPGVAVPDGWSCIPAGPGTRGSPIDEDGHFPRMETLHTVCLTRPYLIRQLELTRGEWSALAPLAPARNGCALDECPVADVNWYEAVAWLNAWSTADGLDPCYVLDAPVPGLGEGCDGADREPCEGPVTSARFDPRCDGYRLPTDAEWERAARGGVGSRFIGGDDLETLDAVAWHVPNADGRAHIGGAWQANAFGLFDVHGNVAEWVFDPLGSITRTSVTDPRGPLTDFEGRVTRGGDYILPPGFMRLAGRASRPPDQRLLSLGIRPVRTLQAPDVRFDCPSNPHYPADAGDLCDGADDDADGTSDEGWPVGQPCARAGNGRGVWACDDAGGLRCVDPPEGAALPEPIRGESCDGWDDDWDGRVDEGLEGCLRCDGLEAGPPCNGCPAGLAVARGQLRGQDVCIPPGVHPRGGADGQRPVRVGPLSAHRLEVLRTDIDSPDLPQTPSCHDTAQAFFSVWAPGWHDALRQANAAGARESLPPCYALDVGCEGGGVCFSGLDCPGYRLPTEAEWEYMAFADAADGVVPGRDRACGPPTGCDDPDAPGPGIPDVEPNPWGLSSLFGAAWEYTHDRWSWRPGEPPWVADMPRECPDDGPCAPTTWTRLDPLPPGALVGRRGGGYDEPDPASCLADYRSVIAHDNQDYTTGARLVRALRRPDLLEPCNGEDDDLDGWIDEVHLGADCSAGIGACRRWGPRACTADGGVECLAVPGEPAEAEDCDGVDDDCDGAVDETHECEPEGPTPICDGACRACGRDDECGPDRICTSAGTCRGCDIATDRGCSNPDPICDPALEVCRPCGGDAECGGRLCVGGRCLACDPDTHEGCGQEICVGGDECAPCQDNIDCGARSPCQGGLCTGG